MPTYQEHTSPQQQATHASRTTLLDNDEVFVAASTYPAGGSLPVHTHRFPSVVYVVEGGSLETTTPDGTVERYDVRPDETLWSPAANAHSARNIGTTPIRIVEIEVKHATPAPHERRATPHAVTSSDLAWKPDPLDPRRSTALLLGDPTKPGPYTVRLRLPAGYEIGLHQHPDDDEQLTVLSGATYWSAGAAGSGTPEHLLTAGGYAFAPAGTAHRIRAVEDSVLQMSGTGPRTYVYLNVSGLAERGSYPSGAQPR